MEGKPKHKVGVIDHYFGHLGVAVINVSSPLRVGDKIRVEHSDGTMVLEEAIESMQIERTKIAEAKPGQSVGLKVSEKVHQGNLVYKV